MTTVEPRRGSGGAQPEAGVIVVGGEALVDIVVGRDDGLAGYLGGGPFNCARTLGRLEQPVAYLGRISSDRFGARLREQLRADGVSLDAVVDTDDPTTLALAELDADGAATYRFYVDGTSSPGLTPETAMSVLPERVEMIHVGTLGLVFEPMADALEAVVSQAGDALVMVDLNIRPPVIHDRGRLPRTAEAAGPPLPRRQGLGRRPRVAGAGP